MKQSAMGRWMVLSLSLLSPVCYFLMFLPLWGGKELAVSNAWIAILFVFQCLCVILAILRFVFCKYGKYKEGLWDLLYALVAVLSAVLTCFVGFFFVLELLGVPWFPQQR